MAAIGVIADDFTGTASAGVFVAKSGARTGLFFDIQSVENFKDVQELDAVYVSTSSRHLEAEQAYAVVHQAAKSLRTLGIQYFSKKIDTTLRGGIGWEIDAMLDTMSQDAVAVVVTAMPQSKRICVGGYSVIDSEILSETFAAKDVKTAVRESYIPHLLGAQTRREIGLIPMNEVLGGAEQIKDKLEEFIQDGKRVIVADAVSMRHIDQIARACVQIKQEVLAVDPGPFTMKLSYYRNLIGEEKVGYGTESEKEKCNTKSCTESEKESCSTESCTGTEKAVLIVAGSANPETKKQIEYLRRELPHCERISVSPSQLISDQAAEEIHRAAECINDAILNKGKTVIIAETGVHGEVIDLKAEDKARGFLPGTSSGKINEGLGRITEAVLICAGQEKIAGIMLTGGDTMECVCRRLGVECIEAIDHIAAQIDVGRMIGRYQGLPMVVKGGFCGSEDIGVKIVRRLMAEAEKE